jgi:hypothetical protein
MAFSAHRVVILLAAAALLAGCAKGTSTTVRVGGFDEVQVDPGENLFRNPRPAGGAAPAFQCCESNSKAKKPPRADIDVVNRTLGQPPNQTGELIVRFVVPLKFDCAVVAGNPRCIGTFSDIRITREPALQPRVGGTIQPTRSQVWWTVTAGKCDGKTYEGKVNVVYIAQYARPGVPAVVQGVKEWLGVDLIAGRGAAPADGGDPPPKGTDHHLDLELSQLNEGQQPTGAVKEGGWREIE